MVEWTEDCEQSFDQLKRLCSDTPVLAYPDYKQKFKLYTDASESGLGAVLAQIKEDGLERPVAYASRTLSKSERNYDAHKLEFLALKWAITDRFHEYLYEEFHDEVDYNVVKAVIHKGESNVSPNIEPELIFDDQKIYMKQLVADLAGKMTKQQWKKEHMDDPEIGPVIRLVDQKKHLQYKATKDDNPGVKIILRFRDDLKSVDGLLYRRWLYRNEVSYLQFLLPVSYRKKTVVACHDQFGHLGMDKTLVLLQERFFWPGMNDDVRTHIRSCERCLRFKQKPEKEGMSSFETSYPMEIVQMDYLVIGSKKNPNNKCVGGDRPFYALCASVCHHLTNCPHCCTNSVQRLLSSLWVA